MVQNRKLQLRCPECGAGACYSALDVALDGLEPEDVADLVSAGIYVTYVCAECGESIEEK